MTRAIAYGVHRATEPTGVLPYQARRLDVSLPLRRGELLIAVDCLNIDSASMRQLAESHDHDPGRVATTIRRIVGDSGKMHNPVTGSGGVLLGRVAAIGADTPSPAARIGDRICPLISLTTTPLRLDDILGVDLHTHQVTVRGEAVIFARSPLAIMPDDLPEALALSALDVCGAPAQTLRLVGPDDRVLIIGAGGRSGLLCTYVAAKRVSDPSRIIAFDYTPEAVARATELVPGVTGVVGDARDAVAVMETIDAVTGGELANLVINCANVPDTEMATILATRERGRAFFFSTATNFRAAALGAESVGQDIDLLMGNGYVKGNGEYALDLLRESAVLRRLLAPVA
jgi:L-erythro-3,5-diaminohexanoate dehydrogenase